MHRMFTDMAATSDAEGMALIAPGFRRQGLLGPAIVNATVHVSKAGVAEVEFVAVRFPRRMALSELLPTGRSADWLNGRLLSTSSCSDASPS